MNPPQGILQNPSIENYYHRATGAAGITAWYTGAVNQLAHLTSSAGVDNIFAYPVVLESGIIDSVAFEVTTGVATSVGRCGIYKNTSDSVMYPSSLVVDGGSQDCSTNAVKTTSSLSLLIIAGLYWFVFACGVATLTAMRAIQPGGLSPITGYRAAMGANAHTIITGAFSYTSLPTTFPAGLPANAAGTNARLVAVHYAS
jgi:hypothetical protein